MHELKETNNTIYFELNNDIFGKINGSILILLETLYSILSIWKIIYLTEELQNLYESVHAV